jgi:hypothetical protein
MGKGDRRTMKWKRRRGFKPLARFAELGDMGSSRDSFGGLGSGRYGTSVSSRPEPAVTNDVEREKVTDYCLLDSLSCTSRGCRIYDFCSSRTPCDPQISDWGAAYRKLEQAGVI